MTTIFQDQQTLCQGYFSYLLLGDNINGRGMEVIALGLAMTNFVNGEQVGERV